MEAKELARVYNGNDANMTETARAIYDLFTLDVASFKAFDSTLDTTFRDAYLAQVEAAEQVVDDNVVIDQIVDLSDKAEETMNLAREKYVDVKYFVQKAFPKSAGIKGESGLHDYERARKSKTQMAGVLHELNLTCNKYNTELIAAGFNQTAIDDILTIRTGLLDKNSSQELLKRQRPKLTEDRILILNACYNTMTQINAAAQRVFRTDYAKQKQYVYMPSSQAEDTFVYAGNVTAATTLTLATVVYTDTTTVSFRNLGTASVTFALSTTDQLEGNVVQLDGGAEITKALVELLIGGTNLIVHNNDATHGGSYEVTVTE